MDDSSTPLASLSVTHVFYNPEDRLSLLCAYLALLPQTLCVVYATLILSTREVEIALAFVGQLACEALNFALKRLIKEQRPLRIHGKGYGMPSSHAQFVTFWSVSLALFLLVRHQPVAPLRSRATGPYSLHGPWTLLERLGVSLVAALIAVATSWSRIYLNYHTPRQVAVGCAAGVVTAVAWFVVTAILRQTGWLSWALEIPLARAFRIRDLVVEEDMCQAGWEKWENKKAARISDRQTKPKTK